MRRVNWKFFVILNLCGVVLIAGAVSLWAINARNSASITKGQAEEAEKNGDLRGAVRYYSEYLAKTPDDYPTQAVRAKLAAQVALKDDARRKDLDLASKWLEDALRQDSLRDRTDLRRDLVEVQLRRPGMLNEALKNIEKLTVNGAPDAKLDFLYAQGAFALKSYDRASPRLERLLGYDPRAKSFDAKRATAPDNVEAYMLLALILREHQTMHEEAEGVVNAMVTANPKSAKALINRSRFKLVYAVDKNKKASLERLESAKKDLRKALEIEPDNVEALIQNSQLMAMDRDYVSAAKYLERARTSNPKNEEIYRRLAGMFYKQDKPKEALATIEQGIVEVPTSQELLWTLYQMHFQQQDLAAAQQTIGRMEKVKMMPERIRLAKARLPMLEQKWSEAADLLEEIRPQLGLYPPLALLTNLSLGDCYLRLRQPDLQLKAYARILETDPNNVDALRGKAAALTALLRFAEAYDVYQKDLHRVMGDEFMADRALLGGYYAVLTAMPRIDPANREHYERQATIIRKHVGEDKTNPVEVAVLKADALLRSRKEDEAISLLTKAIAENPKELRLRLSLVSAVAAKQGLDAALIQLTETERALGASHQTNLVRVELELRKGGPEVKQRLAKLEEGISALRPEEQVEMWSRMGRNYYRLGGDREDVLRCWRQALLLRPNDGTLLEGLFELGREAGDNQAMTKALEDIEKQLGRDSSLWQYGEAARLLAQARERGVQVSKSNLDQADKLVAQAVAQRADWYMLLRLQGEIADLRQDYDTAVRYYQKTLDQGPPNVPVVRRLIEIQLSRNQFNEARQSMQRLGDASVALGRLAILPEVLGGGDPGKALKLLEREVPEQSSNPGDLLWKSQLLLRLSQSDDADAALRKSAVDKAEAALRRAAQLGSNIPQTWLALVEFLTKFRSGADAERVIRDAENQLSEDQAVLVLAQSYVLLGAYEQAEHYYQTALQNGPKTPLLARTVANFYLTSKQPRKAEPLLKSLVAAAATLRPEDQQHVAWARREWAQLQAQSAAYPIFQAAVKLIEDNISSSGGSPADSLLIGRFYAMRGDVRSLRQAEQILEKYKTDPAFGFDERLALSNVYLATNQWEKGRRMLEELHTEKPQDFRPIMLMADALLKKRETDSAQTWVRRLEQLLPDAPQTLRLGALLAMRGGHPDEAEQIVVAKLPQQVTADNAGQFLQAALILEQVKHFPAAEKLLRAAVAAAPKTRLDLAAFLARRGRTAECLALIKEQWSDETLDAACSIGSQAIREQKNSTGVVDPAASKLVLSWFEQARTRPQRSLDSRLNEALLLESLGQTKEIERIHREMLALAGVPDFVRGRTANNLAYLLAINGGNMSDAQQLIDFAIAQTGPAPELMDTQAMVALAKGNPSEAVKILREATQFQGTPEMFFHLALACQKADDATGAVRSLVRAREEGLNEKTLSSTEQQWLAALDAWLISKTPASG